MIERYTYAAYGQRTVYSADYNQILSGSTIAQQNGWQGRPYADHGNIIDSRYRYLNFTLFTWLNPDPLRYVDGGNYFVPYGRNGISRLDPTGLLIIAGCKSLNAYFEKINKDTKVIDFDEVCEGGVSKYSLKNNLKSNISIEGWKTSKNPSTTPIQIVDDKIIIEIINGMLNSKTRFSSPW